ncbi:HNH endonuclease [Mucilaginibacter psychrotolerans]|uniref:HNH endonuclease n=1 Tax=Mucilaginibacter psychrotolerans TaxID=1524096 RepID=UPI0013053DAD|nr:HNH endonuclease [Mucilaginibacter psychrotolerans]
MSVGFEAFLEKDLIPNSSIFLTLEHVPPESLGGKGTILTCKKCNSESGRTLDAELLKYLEGIDFEQFLPNSKQSTPMTLNGKTINARINVEENGLINLHFDPNRSNPKIFAEVVNEIERAHSFDPDQITNLSGNIPRKKHDARIMEIALLRIAYLKLFQTFGYAALLNHGMLFIREQIANPNKDILERPQIMIADFPEGISIIKSPIEIQCFLVTFNLKTKSATRKFNVMLPGPSGVNIDIYKNYRSFVLGNHEKSNVPLAMEYLPEKKYVSNLNLAFGYHYYWQTFTKS